MSLEEKNMAIVLKVVKEVNKQNLAVIDESIATDYFDHTNQLRGRENVKQFHTIVFKDFPDFHRTIEDIIAEGAPSNNAFNIACSWFFDQNSSKCNLGAS